MKKNKPFKKESVIKVESFHSIDSMLTFISSSLSFEEIERFIVNLDLLCEDWGVTCKLIQHFKALEQEYLAEVPNEALLPKKLQYV